jgi:hypothetical protein
MEDIEQIKKTIKDSKWIVEGHVPEQYKYPILCWLQKTCNEIVKTGWAPHPNLDHSIKQLSIK